MSQLVMRQLLETRLNTMSPALSTSWQNVPFTPIIGTPYQRAAIIPVAPDNSAMGQHFYFEQVIFQVVLCYPENTGSNAAMARAEALRAWFKRGTSLVGTYTVIVKDTPAIAPAMSDAGWYMVPVSIGAQASINY